MSGFSDIGKSPSVLIKNTPTVSTSPAYTANDQLGGLQTLSNAVRGAGSNGIVMSVAICDKAKQSQPLNILFFDAIPTITSTDNGILDISDSEMALKCIGKISIAATDYVTLNLNSFAAVTAIADEIASTTGDLYAIAQTTGTPTYVSTTDLTFIYGIEDA